MASRFFSATAGLYRLSRLIQPWARSQPASVSCFLMPFSTRTQKGSALRALAKPTTFPFKGAPVYATPFFAMAR